MTTIEKLPAQFRRNADAADNLGLPKVADHMRYAAREVEQAEKPEPTTLEDKTIELSEVLAWADGIRGALGTEHAAKVEEMEARIAYAITQAQVSGVEHIGPYPDRNADEMARMKRDGELDEIGHGEKAAGPTGDALQWLDSIANFIGSRSGAEKYLFLPGLKCIREALTARGVPDGYKLMPIEPTEKLVETLCGWVVSGPDSARRLYARLMADEPQPEWPGAGEALAMTEAAVEAQTAGMATDATCECGKRPRELFGIEHSDTGDREWKLATHCTECLEQMAAPASEEAIDEGAVDDFAADMKRKLSKAREKGRSGWHDPLQCSGEKLAEMLVEHVRKSNPGNYLDVANLAMMLHHRREPAELLREAFQNAAPRGMSTELQDVVEELQSARALHPGWPCDPIHAAQIVQEEAGELGRAVLQLTYESGKATMGDARKEAVQTAAMAVRFLEHFAAYSRLRAPMVHYGH